jgi:RNA-binding proteins (RRM domain)
MKLHIGNLSPKVTEDELKQLFSQFGNPTIIDIEWSRWAGRSGGVAIVEMNLTDAMIAARELNGRPFHSRRLYITLMGGGRVDTPALNGNASTIQPE